MNRLKEATNFIIENCDDPTSLGTTKLNKILWFADVKSYLVTGKSITNANYIKQKQGPVPVGMVDVMKSLEEDGIISIEQPSDRYDVREFTSKMKMDDSIFSETEKENLEGMSKIIREKFSASDISKISHDVIWEAASINEMIPLQAMLVNEEGDYNENVREWADSVISNLS